MKKLNGIQKMGVAGAGIFVLGLLAATVIVPVLLNSEIKRRIALKKGSMMREIWGKFPFSMEFSFYMFNVTNPDGVTNGEKPMLEQIGPYVYDEWQEKTNQMDHEEDDTVSYTLRNTYYFNQQKSGHLTGHEEIVVPRLVVLGLVNILLRDRWGAISLAGKAVDNIFHKPESMFERLKVKDILFDGIAFECKAKDFAGSIVCNELRGQYEDLGIELLGEDEYSFSLWKSMNATDSKGRIRVKRGLKNIMDVGTVVEYNNKPNISIWEDDYCDEFNGTDGTIFHPFFDKKGREDLVAYNAGLCRSVSCYFHSKSKFAGLKTLRYTADLGVDGENNPHHKCYCIEPDRCLKQGAYDVYKCVHMPLIVTNPHFYMAHPSYLSQVRGLDPDPEKHAIAIDLDAFTGSPMRAHTRAQFNMFLTKLEKFRLMKDFPEALLPILWIDEYMVLPDFLIKQIKVGHVLYTIAITGQYLLMFGGLALGGFAAFRHFKSIRGENKLDSSKTVSEADSNPNSAEKKTPLSVSALRSAPVPPTVD